MWKDLILAKNVNVVFANDIRATKRRRLENKVLDGIPRRCLLSWELQRSHSQSARAKAGIIFSIRANFTGHYSPKECQLAVGSFRFVRLYIDSRETCGNPGSIERRRVDYFSAWSLNSSMPIMIGHISSTQQPLFNYKSHRDEHLSFSPPLILRY